MDLENTYFFTATILNWNHLLKDDKMKNILIGSLEFLIAKKKLKVYGFVIMPNHVHLTWRNLEMNGKEFPDESFLKFTGHELKNHLIKESLPVTQYMVDKADRQFQFWQRSSLPIRIFSRQMLEQKLNYSHMNPLQPHWDMVTDPNEYLYSSCSFYERQDLRFNWLTDYREDFN